MNYIKTKVYNDGSHFIGIPKQEQSWKKRKNKQKLKDKKQEKIKEIYNSNKEETKKEKVERTIEVINEKIKDIEKSKQLVNEVLEKEKRNKIVRMTRLFRKVNLQKWNYFCTFTYDSLKINDEEFRKKLLYTLRHLSSRKGWKYIGVFERSPENNRLHFHGLFVITEMIGELIETKDYNTKKHEMQITIQNTFFLERFGRNDFKSLENFMLNNAVKYLLKYIQKTGEKIIYSRHLQTFFVTDILEEDVVCTIGQENRKILLFDDFKCMDLETGEIIGNVSFETIDKLEKSN